MDMKYIKQANPFYKSAAWQKLRREALARDRGMCCECMLRANNGIGTVVRRATMVHHIIPIEERPDLALEISNLQSLCDACHNREHPERNRRDEDVHAHKMRVIKI